MCYFISQKTGKQVELSKQAHAAFRAGDLDKAEEIYFSVTGEKFMPHNKTVDSAWLAYCMPDRIRNHYNWDELNADNIPNSVNERRFYEILAYRATEKYGGEWEVCWEY